MEMVDIYTSLISGLFAAVLSVIVTLVINFYFHTRYVEKSFSETRMKLNEIMLKEPFLRTEDIFKELQTGDAKEDNIRLKKFDLFCIMQFNYLKSLCDYYGYNMDKKFIKKYNFAANVSSFKEWWQKNHAKNTERYEKKFVKFIDDYSHYKPALPLATQR
jgi:hypothetical protein